MKSAIGLPINLESKQKGVKKVKNVIYGFFGITALEDAKEFITTALGLGIDSSCIDMMQSSEGTDKTVNIDIAVYATLTKHLMLDAFYDKLMNM